MNIWLRQIGILGIIGILAIGNAYPQEPAKKKTTRVRIDYFRHYDKSESLLATLRIREERYIPFIDALVHFYYVDDTSRILIDKVRTNSDGEAILLLKDTENYSSDSLGNFTFEAEYLAERDTKGSKRSATIRQANLNMSFFQKDTIKSIEVELTTFGDKGEMVPIADKKIKFYVKGTFSLYNFETQKTDGTGKVEVDFPIYMPGDTSGVLTVIAKVEEDKMLGTISSEGRINWGIRVPLAEEKQRGLGDTDAPLWMVYTLIILLSVVWFHYLYVVFMIIRIKMVKQSY